MKKILTLALLTVATASFAQELVVNGGFEDNATGTPNGWTGTLGGFSGINNGSGTPHGGVNYYGMGATSAASQTDLFQDIATTVGTTYNVSYWAYDEDTTSTGGFLVTFGGAQIGPNALTSSYAQYTGTFVATSTTTRLEFTGWETNQWKIVDDFSVQAAVPEPASMSVLGLGAIALIRRRRNRK